MSTTICTSCGFPFRRKPEETWRTTCVGCWRKGARREPVPVHIHRCSGDHECEARATLRELAIRVPVLLNLIDATPPSMEREFATTFLRAVVQRVAEIEGGR